MSKFDEKVSLYLAELEKFGQKVDSDLLTKVTKGCGPSIYLADASLVSLTDPDEVGRVKKNFLIGKLGLSESDELDSGISAVEAIVGKSNRNKYRPVVYYLLTKHFKKESVFA
ncbi:MAG TPA: DUF2853 family protein [Saprospiraceae bacterium]|nr:DUF2853 family protein [Saprospiraceae bacterium]